MEKEHLNKVQTANEVKVSQFHCFFVVFLFFFGFFFLRSEIRQLLKAYNTYIFCNSKLWNSKFRAIVRRIRNKSVA